ncbi:MAG: AI-2E family transporter, partial [Deltaproteobacteria bacterium]|nr:AI-2E family transporter [Deltaproteobacteria bacterium]
MQNNWARSVPVRFSSVILFIVGLTWMAYLLREVLTPILVAFLIAYVLEPLVSLLERKGFNRALAVGFIMFLLIAFIAVAFLFIIPTIQQELQALISQFPSYLEKLQKVAIPYIEKRFKVHFPATIEEMLVQVKNHLVGVDASSIIDRFKRFLGLALSGAFNLVSWTVSVILVPVFIFYFLNDFNKIIIRVKAY